MALYPPTHTHTLFPGGSTPWERQVQRGPPRLWFPVLVPGPPRCRGGLRTELGNRAHSRSRRSFSISDKHTLARKEGRKDRGSPMGQSPAHAPGSVGPALVPWQSPAFPRRLEPCSPCLPLAASPFSQSESLKQTQEGSCIRNDPVSDV